jgi:adenosylmethionine-8-amino-7-oxononanoate aminotransferase
MTIHQDDLAATDRAHYWHAFTQMAEYEPLIIHRGEGVWLFDAEGKRYLDGVSSLWCNLLGHRHPRIDQAITRQLEQVAHVTSLGMSHPTPIRLARRLAEISPGDLQHVFFASDGSCAVEVALKTAFQYWRQTRPARPAKTKYLALGNAYHGDTIGSASVGGIDRFHTLFAPLLFEVVQLPSPDADRLPEGVAPEQATAYYLGQLETALAAHHQELAALVIEPLVQGAAGMVMQPPGYLRGVRELTQRYDVLMIADEIVTGFGRTGRMFACQHEEITPDLLCLGKSLSGGYLPIAATLSTPRIYEAFLGSYTDGKMLHNGHTYGGNPLAAAAALATIDELVEHHWVEEHVPRKAQWLSEALEPLRSHPCVRQIRQLGLIAGVELVADRDSDTPFPPAARAGYRACRHATQHGVALRPLGDVVVVMPPLIIERDEIQLLGRVLGESLDTLCPD